MGPWFDKTRNADYDAIHMTSPILDEPPSQVKSALASLDRLSLLVSFVLVGLTLSSILDLPSRRIDFSFLGSDANITVSGTWFLALLLAGLTAAGVDSIARTHPRVHLGEVQYIFILWILPSMIVVAATLVLALSEVRVYGLIGVVVAGALLVLVVLGEYITIDLNDRWYSTARLGINLAVYLAALVLFATIYSWKVRSLYSAPAIGIAAGLLALELFRGSEADLGRTWLFAAAVALSIAEFVWALNYWNATAFTGGGLLLVFFYALTGVTQQYLWGRLSKFVFVEFSLITLGAITLLFWWKPR
ncbi:MAG: hypothetical protein M1132_01370 [Chloroflexi bacterium]|nr:hypothetical protein [Chloroflexota bacterium]